MENGRLATCSAFLSIYFNLNFFFFIFPLLDFNFFHNFNLSLINGFVKVWKRKVIVGMFCASKALSIPILA